MPSNILRPEEISSTPITLPLLAHTGNMDGDDGFSELLGFNYRGVPCHPDDETDPDPLVIVDIRSLNIYANGAVPGVCVYYDDEGFGAGLGGPNIGLVRAPFNNLLNEAAAYLLEHFGLELVLLDGFRPWWVQTSLWRWLFNRLYHQQNLTGRLTVEQVIRLGDAADEVGSYCAALDDAAFQQAKAEIITSELRTEIGEASINLDRKPSEVVTTYLTYLVNLGNDPRFKHIVTFDISDLKLNEGAVTAHGGGGAADLWLFKNSKPVQMLAPFDFLPRAGGPNPGRMLYAEETTWEDYAAEVALNPDLQRYQSELGVTEITEEIFNEGRANRRILFHVMQTIFGCTTYNGEDWHFNSHNALGGKQSKVLISGNGCQAFLRNTVLPETGRITAVWSNSVGHRLAAEDFGIVRNAA